MGESMSKHKDEEEQVRELWQHLFYIWTKTLSLTHWIGDFYTLLKNTTVEHSEILVILETFEQTDEDTWPDRQKDDDKDKYNDKDI